EALASDLDDDVWMCKKIVVPVGMLVRSGVGRDNHVALAVAHIAQRRHTGLSGASADGREEEQRAVGQPSTELAAIRAELHDQCLVERAHITRQLHRGVSWCCVNVAVRRVREGTGEW